MMVCTNKFIYIIIIIFNIILSKKNYKVILSNGSLCAGQNHFRRRYFAGRTSSNNPKVIFGCKNVIKSELMDFQSVKTDMNGIMLIEKMESCKLTLNQFNVF